MTGILITDIDFTIKVSCICFEILSLEFVVILLANEFKSRQERGRKGGKELGGREGKKGRGGEGERGEQGCSLV